MKKTGVIGQNRFFPEWLQAQLSAWKQKFMYGDGPTAEVDGQATQQLLLANLCRAAPTGVPMPWCDMRSDTNSVCCCLVDDPGGMRELIDEDMPVSFQEDINRERNIKWESRYLTCEVARDSARAMEKARHRKDAQTADEYQEQFVRMVGMGTKDEDVKALYFVTHFAAAA